MDPLAISTEPPKQKFGEIYCDYMGVLSFHCVLCPTSMDHSDEFILHYMIHFKDVFEIKQEAEYIEPIFEVEFETESIKEEFQEDSSTHNRDTKCKLKYLDENYACTDQSFGKEIDTHRSKRRRQRNSEVKKLIKDNIQSCPSEPKICSICGQEFARISSYERHIASHGTAPSRYYTCDICGGKIKEKRYLHDHMLALHSGLPKIKVPCNICGKEFSRKYLKLHVIKHNILDRKPSHMCAICGKSFLISEDLTAHIRKHKKKSAPCNVCGKTFAVAGLADHQRVHTGERPYECSICSRRFRTRNILSVHRTIHWTGKNFACDICETKFKNPAGLKSHKRTVHGKKIAKIKTKDVIEVTAPLNKQENLIDTKFANIRTYSKYDKNNEIIN